jgi:pilin isopeptide linkage protein/LPXTG-motif cell wall-anchored protein
MKKGRKEVEDIVMKRAQFKKMAKAVGMGMALLLTVCAIPSQVFAEESPKATVSLEVEAQVSGDEFPEKENFTFILASQDETAPMPESNTVTIHGAGRMAFGEIEYTEIGTYEYTIAQQDKGLEGCTYDDSIYYVTVSIGRREDDSLFSVITARKGISRSKSDDIIYYNEYTSPIIEETETPSTEETTEKETETETPAPEETKVKETKTPTQPTNNTTKAPKTGDTMNIPLLLAMLLISGALIGLIGFLWKTRKN